MAGDVRTARAGTSYVDSPQTREAAARAAREAHEAAGGGAVSLALAFHHGRHDPMQVRAGVLDALGPDVPLLGGSAMGVITGDALGYEGHQIGVAVLADAPDALGVHVADGLGARGEQAVGADLAQRLAGNTDDLLLLYSSVKTGLSDQGMELFFGTPLLAGLAPALGDRVVGGAGLIDAAAPGATHLMTTDGVLREGAAAITIGGGLRMHTAVLHGCRPLGRHREITATDGPVVLEIDGRPALEVVDELMGGGTRPEEYPFRVILGVNRGERFGPYDPDSYQTRLCLAIDPQRGGLVMFEPDLQAGTSVQLMHVSMELDYVRDRVASLLEEVGARRPVLAVYADCAGRCKALSPIEEEEGDAVRAALGDIPLLGFYTGVEIARVGGEVRPLDVTGVLCIISA